MDFSFDYTLRTVALGAAILGLVSGALGTFAVLRQQSLLGDAISHAALPGIVLAFMLTGSKAPLVLVLGAAIAGWLGTLLVLSIVRNTRIKDDSALGLVLSVFFGFGLVLLTFVQRWPDATPGRTGQLPLRPGGGSLAARRTAHGPARRPGFADHGPLLEGVQAAQLRPRIRGHAWAFPCAPSTFC